MNTSDLVREKQINVRLNPEELERLARQSGYNVARLETGDRQPEAIHLYERSGYHRIPNFGIYAGSQRSVCFEKRFS